MSDPIGSIVARALRPQLATVDPVEALLQAVLAPPMTPVRKFAQATTPIIGTANEQQLAYCVVIEPEQPDSDGELMSAEDIEKAAHRFLTQSRIVKSMHRTQIDAVPVESYIAPQRLDFDHPTLGQQTVQKGSWVMGIHVKDPAHWAKVKSGEYNGFSVGGFGARV